MLNAGQFSMQIMRLSGSVFGANQHHAFSADLLVRQFGLIFSFGLLLAAPVLFCVYLVEVGLAVISRNLPQMNIFMISMPVKIVCGLLLLSLLTPRLAPLFDKIFGSIFHFWQEVL